MNGSRFCRSLLWFLLLLLTTVAAAQPPPPDPYTPRIGAPGKDVFWVPTPQILAQRMLDLAGVSPKDLVVDLGSGDGRIVIEAARRGARALGVESNPEMVAYARRAALREGVAERTRFVEGDLFTSDFSDATVVTLFLLPELNIRLRPQILAMKPGTRVVSHYFDMGDWSPDRRLIISRQEGCPQMHCEGLFWVVPAAVAGRWQMPRGVLTLAQQFQEVTGTLTIGAVTLPLAEGRLAGDRLTFAIGTSRYAARVDGAALAGTVETTGGTAAWTARRLP